MAHNNPKSVTEPEAQELIIAEEEAGLSYWQLVWRRLRKNRLAMAAFAVILVFYITMVVFPEFFAPYPVNYRDVDRFEAPPMRVRFIDADGQFSLRPFVYDYEMTRDPRSLRRIYEEDTDKKRPLYFFVRGEPYSLWGLLDSNLHLFGNPESNIFLLGTDRQGRCILSRILFAGRISLTIGLLGVLISMVVGTFIGILSGYVGGLADQVIQRGAEILMSFPEIPLWMALAAAIPRQWSIEMTFFAITVLLSLITWGGLSRQVRGMVLSLKERDFVAASEAMGVSRFTIIHRHLIPNCLSHVIVVATLAIPKMVIGETALSFLGIGMRAPAVSWGVLLQYAQNINVIAITPWLMIPTIPLFIIVLAFNTFGDGFRDAADPYSSQ